jgi:hypothetical protein
MDAVFFAYRYSALENLPQATAAGSADLCKIGLESERATTAKCLQEMFGFGKSLAVTDPLPSLRFCRSMTAIQR